MLCDGVFLGEGNEGEDSGKTEKEDEDEGDTKEEMGEEEAKPGIDQSA